MQKSAVIGTIVADKSVRAAVENPLSALGRVVLTFGSTGKFLQSDHADGAGCVIAAIDILFMNGADQLVRSKSTRRLSSSWGGRGRIEKDLEDGATRVLLEPF